MKEYICNGLGHDCPACTHGLAHDAEENGCADNEEFCETIRIDVKCVEIQ